jgi:carbon-monoxide dehydrogenase medium subunit
LQVHRLQQYREGDRVRLEGHALKPFLYHRPASVEEASAVLAQAEEARFLAGGMTLIPSLKHGLVAPSALVDLGAIAGLKGVSIEGDEVVIGAMTTHAAVASSAVVNERLPALGRLAGGIGDAQVRHRGTLGGSVANNDPAADYPAACLGLGAAIVTNRRTLLADEFFTDFFSTALAPAEVITSIRFPIPERAAYVKLANPASRYAMVGVFVAQFGERVRVSVTGAGRRGVFRVREMEAALKNDFTPEGLPAHSVAPADLNADLHASAAYRSHLINVLAKRAIAECGGVRVHRPMRHGGAFAY